MVNLTHTFFEHLSWPNCQTKVAEIFSLTSFRPKYICPYYFWFQNCFDQNIVSTQKSLDLKYFRTTFFSAKLFYGSIFFLTAFFWVKLFMDQKSWTQNFFWHRIFLGFNLFSPNFFAPMYFYQKLFVQKIVGPKEFSINISFKAAYFLVFQTIAQDNVQIVSNYL